MRSAAALDRTLLAAAFLLSGAAGLCHEMVWTRLLALVFGSTTLALTIITAVYMAGLALGAWLAGRYADRARDPVRDYALLEAGIAAFALAFPPLVAFFGVHWHRLVPSGATDPLLSSLLRFAAGFVLLLPATAAIGATLPLLARQYVRTMGRVGADLGILYGINALGGAVGCWLTGTRLILHLGLYTTIGIAACLSVAAAGLAAWVSWRGRRRPRPSSRPPPAQAQSQRRAVSLRLLLPLVFASGLSFLAYEIQWVRLLRLFNPATPLEGFSLVLSVCLLGLALGSLLYPLLPKALVGLPGVALIQLVPAVLGLLPYLALSWLCSEPTLGRSMVLAYAAMGATSLAYGLLFPLYNALGTRHFSQLGASVGAVYAFITLGNIAGSFLAGFVLVPQLGLAGGLACCAGLNALVALAAALSTARGRRSLVAVSLFISGALLAVVLNMPAHPYLQQQEGERVIWYRDGLAASTAVLEQQSGERTLIVEVIYARVRPAGIVPEIPILLHEDPHEMLLIGFGTGVNSRRALEVSPELQLTAVELDGNQILTTGFFAPDASRLQDDPRFTFVNDDGRSFLQGSGPRFDIVATDINTFYASYDLHSVEFNELVRAKLRPGGVFCHRLATRDISSPDVHALVASFLAVFPEASLWQIGQEVFLLIGQERPFSLDAAAIAQRMRTTSTGMGYPDQLISRLVAGPVELARLAGDARPITDHRPRFTIASAHPEQADVLEPLLLREQHHAHYDLLGELDGQLDLQRYLRQP